MNDPDEPPEYDATGITREELELLQWEIGHDLLDWDDMTVYDDLPEPPADPTPEATP